MATRASKRIKLNKSKVTKIIGHAIDGNKTDSPSSTTVVIKKSTSITNTSKEKRTIIPLSEEEIEEKVKRILTSKSASNPHLENGLKHILKIDPILEELANSTNYRKFIHHEDNSDKKQQINCFEQLSSGILSQQISGAAARSIKGKFINLYHKSYPTPQDVKNSTDDELRSVGLSRAKVVYIKALADAFITKRVPPCRHYGKDELNNERLCCKISQTEFTNEFLINASDEEIIEALTRIKGIGVWSADMFLLFGLCRLDVFSCGDLGIARGISAYLLANNHSIPKPTKKWIKLHSLKMNEIANPFKPYRSIFMLLMWQAASTDVASLEEK